MNTNVIIRIANATEEFFVRRRPLYEVVGQLGMWATIINGVQASALEHKKMTESPWNGAISMFGSFTMSTQAHKYTSSRSIIRIYFCDVHPLHCCTNALSTFFFCVLQPFTVVK